MIRYLCFRSMLCFQCSDWLDYYIFQAGSLRSGSKTAWAINILNNFDGCGKWPWTIRIAFLNPSARSRNCFRGEGISKLKN